MRKFIKTLRIYVAIFVFTLAFFDLILIATGMFPPSYEQGEPGIGWVTKAPAVEETDACLDAENNLARIDYRRNDIGIRSTFSSQQLASMPEKLMIAAVGDSHSDQCMHNADTHQGVMESRLYESGVDALVLSNGVGRYSPLQAYLLYKIRLQRFGPKVLVMNLYTGNDFIDILRIDDRPHFVSDGDDYRIADPHWMRYADPEKVYRSRVAYIGRQLGDSLGIRGPWIRMKMLRSTAGSDQGSLSELWSYIGDVRNSVEPDVGYSGALAAQFLNQQLFFHHFPDAPNEAAQRIAALMQMIRDENPGLTLVMSPIPSYQLVTPTSRIDAALANTLDRLPIDDTSSKSTESDLYHRLRSYSQEYGWHFVDNLEAMLAYDGGDRLYNDYDYHVTRAASQIIGENEARIIGPLIAPVD